MSWDQNQFLERLQTAVDKFDGEVTARLCQELVEHLENEEASSRSSGGRSLGPCAGSATST